VKEDHRSLRITSGKVGLSISHPSVRAIVEGSEGHELWMSYKYNGPTEDKIPLKSGQYRHQVGIKLQALDGDNVLYAMWRWEPDSPRIWTTTKVNGQYIPPTSTYLNVDVPAPTPGERYIMSARQDGRIIRVWWQGVIAWVGEIAESAMLIRGPAGIRTDNASIGELSLLHRTNASSWNQ